MTALNAVSSKTDLKNTRVLIIDDQEPNRKLLAALVTSMGVGFIEHAKDGVEGLAKVESFKPDLILLDIMMPNMDGFEMCRLLRKNPEWRDMPVLVNTALSEPRERVECFEAGATDMVVKPINAPEVLARVRIHLENRLLVGTLRQYHERVAQELAMASQMQRSLLPDPTWLATLPATLGLTVESRFETSSELGGDFWHLRSLEDGRLGLVLADFSGHGISAALNAFRLHTLFDQHPPGLDPAKWMAELNNALKPLLPVGQFATVLYAIFDMKNNRIDYAAGGAPSPILMMPGQEPVLMDASGIFLGAMLDADYENMSIDFPEGAQILLYSDALTEDLDKDELMLEESGLMELAKASQGEAMPLEYLMSRFESRFPPPWTDDLTAIWIRHSGRKNA
ncbi:MAG: fused response regulator/phosphatase [Alphaproteobacteria bacterium]|nr:fused response regulator/phosphatase [Alphaproteobacteria bacterium]